ncbi:hypothetical protein FisN_36Lh033 [Fistulifera solaris]|uniref:Uncharacterized protein n=1 Tax=Fistulifera solaris TaxID=1519565 RepID=A0A1Z5JI11_FISSO|nr:hypothetical protein FisN_36Lh033 [Fistulifera solaris]|eukprot:GAX13482.1 hypothetical protein FisN_36Lh033 [Fistulifera solaris]
MDVRKESLRNAYAASGMLRSQLNATPQRRKPLNTSTTRIYRAPQAAVRDETDGKTRRRRQPEDSSFSTLEAPWDDDSDRGNRSSRRSLTLRQGFEEFSESFVNNNDYDDYHNEYYVEPRRNLWVVLRTTVNYQTAVQVLILLVFAAMIFDSHSRVQKHRVQLAQYDEERAHILEQMMWIDKAAKKVHRKYAQKDIWESLEDQKLEHESRGALLEDTEGLRDAMKKLQLRVQLNARTRIEDRFGIRNAFINLALDEEGKEHVQIGLTDDTPHAAAILLEQYDRHLWDKVELQRIGDDVIQISTDQTTTSPILEFIESSHSCHEVGSVVLRQLEADTMDLNVVVLRVHMTEHVPMGGEDVCIGKVTVGLEYLNKEGIPRIHETPPRVYAS